MVPAFKNNCCFFTITALLLGLTAYSLIHSFAEGRLGSTITIYESSVVLTFILSFLILKEKDEFIRRFVGAVLCVLGVAVYCF